MTKKLLLLSSCTLLPCTAQTTYDWTFTPDVDAFGDNRPNSVTSPSINVVGDYTYSALTQFGDTFNPASSDNGLEAGRATRQGSLSNAYGSGTPLVMQMDPGRRGYFMGSDPTSSFNLSTTGSSVTMRTANWWKRGFVGSALQGATGDIGSHLYQLGLTNGVSYGSAGNESVILAADLRSVGSTQNNDSATYGGTGDFNAQYVPTQVNFNVLDQLGIDNVPDFQWNHTPTLTVASNVPINIQYSNAEWPNAIHPGLPSNLYFTTLTFTNLGDGKLGLGTSVIGALGYDTDGNLRVADEFTQETTLVSEYVEFDHNFSDLSDLRPSFGFVNDADFEFSVSSGVTFSWDDSFPDVTPPIPEPSSLSLLILAMIGLASHRRR